MKCTLLITALATAIAAQSITDLPSCSLVCLSTAIAGLGCGLTDNACSCKQAAKLTPSVTSCVQSSCKDPVDQKKTIDVLAGICAAAGFPIEAPAAPAAPAPEEKSTPVQAPSQAPVEKPSATEADYPAYPTATEASSEAPAPSSLTPDASSSICSGAVTETVTVTHPSPRPTSASAVIPPYPTGPLASSVPAPSGTGVSSYTPVPEFTGAAAAMNVPVVAAGMLGLAAFVL